MADLMKDRGAFVWTELSGQAYRLVGFNQSGRGVYIVGNESHMSFHRDGNCHTRSAEGAAEEAPELPFKLPALKDIEVHRLAAQWLSINPDAIRSFGCPIPKPSADSQAVYIDRDAFGPNSQPILECFLYSSTKRAEVIASVELSNGHYPHMECLDFKEYVLDRQAKILVDCPGDFVTSDLAKWNCCGGRGQALWEA